jgi:hypothetical protein
MGKNKIKLFTKYENVTQEVLSPIESLLQNAKNFNMQFYFVVSGLKIIGHGNFHNNLESHCIYWTS